MEADGSPKPHVEELVAALQRLGPRALQEAGRRRDAIQDIDDAVGSAGDASAGGERMTGGAIEGLKRDHVFANEAMDGAGEVGLAVDAGANFTGGLRA